MNQFVIQFKLQLYS